MTQSNYAKQPIATFEYVYTDDSCITKLTSLVEAFQVALHGENAARLELKDMFYYGTFCTNGTYADFDWSAYAYQTFDVPEILSNGLATAAEREEYVTQVINMIMTGAKKRPEWMKFVEENATCDEYDSAPSTFLRLVPKDEKYNGLAQALLGFLYSPNRQTSMFL